MAFFACNARFCILQLIDYDTFFVVLSKIEKKYATKRAIRKEIYDGMHLVLVDPLIWPVQMVAY